MRPSGAGPQRGRARGDRRNGLFRQHQQFAPSRCAASRRRAERDRVRERGRSPERAHRRSHSSPKSSSPLEQQLAAVLVAADPRSAIGARSHKQKRLGANRGIQTHHEDPELPSSWLPRIASVSCTPITTTTAGAPSQCDFERRRLPLVSRSSFRVGLRLHRARSAVRSKSFLRAVRGSRKAEGETFVGTMDEGATGAVNLFFHALRRVQAGGRWRRRGAPSTTCLRRTVGGGLYAQVAGSCRAERGQGLKTCFASSVALGGGHPLAIGAGRTCCTAGISRSSRNRLKSSSDCGPTHRTGVAGARDHSFGWACCC